MGDRGEVRHHTELSAWALRSVERPPQSVVAAMQASAMAEDWSSPSAAT